MCFIWHCTNCIQLNNPSPILLGFCALELDDYSLPALWHKCSSWRSRSNRHTSFFHVTAIWWHLPLSLSCHTLHGPVELMRRLTTTIQTNAQHSLVSNLSPSSFSGNQVRNDRCPAALHQSGKGAVSWLWLPSLVGFISYYDEIFIKGTSYFSGKHRAPSFKTAYIINKHLYQHNGPILATVCTCTNTHTRVTHILKHIQEAHTHSYKLFATRHAGAEFPFGTLWQWPITVIAKKGLWKAQ